MHEYYECVLTDGQAIFDRTHLTTSELTERNNLANRATDGLIYWRPAHLPPGVQEQFVQQYEC